MADLGLSIAATGLAAQQAAMDTLSQNVANANTPGYVQETANLTASPVVNSLGIGGGAEVLGVTQAPDGLMQAGFQQAQGALAQSTALQQVLDSAQTAFREPSQSGLASQLAAFWQSWDGIVQNPSSLAARTQVANEAQNIVSSLQQASSQLAQLQTNAQGQLSSLTAQDNTQLAELARLNAQIVAVQETGAAANSLIDQRNQLETQLATDLGAVAQAAGDGTDTLRVGGVTLVQGNFAESLHFTGVPGSMALVTQTSQVDVPTTGGTASGLLAAINQYLPSYQSQLDNVAGSLATTVNSQLASGYTALGVSGSAYPLFLGSTASGLSVNPAVSGNPQLIAASSTGTLPDATNDGTNAQAMAELASSATGPDQGYRILVQNLGSQLQAVNNQVSAQTSVANAAQQNLQAVAGVNTDQQMVQMLNFQQAYQASAKVISTVSAMIQSLLSAT